MKDGQGIDCRRCSFFYVTWERKFPYGCKALGFKSALMPSLEVRQASGVACLRFEVKRGGKKHV